MKDFKNLLGILVLPLIIPVLIIGLISLQVKVFGKIVGGVKRNEQERFEQK